MWQSETARSPLRRQISEMLEARMTGQISQLMSYFSPDVVVHCACSRGSLLGPGGRAADALRSITRLTDENFQPLEYEILDILVDGAKAVVRWRGAWRHHATAQVCSIDAAHFLHWRSGVVIANA